MNTYNVTYNYGKDKFTETTKGRTNKEARQVFLRTFIDTTFVRILNIKKV